MKGIKSYLFSRTLTRVPGKGGIDEVGLNVHPVLLGSGVPAFLDPGSRVNLELTECRQLEGGCVLVLPTECSTRPDARGSPARTPAPRHLGTLVPTPAPEAP